MHSIDITVIEDVYTIYFDDRKYGVFWSIDELNRALSDLYSRIDNEDKEW